MKPGEYTSEDGDHHAFVVGEDGWVHWGNNNVCDAADARKAGEALIALADELETEYVSLPPTAFNYRRIVLKAGVPVRAEFRNIADTDWREMTDDFIALLLAAFRAGQERGPR